MGPIKRLLAAWFGEISVVVDGGRATEAEEVAWQEYHSQWEMDPPPPPRAVFLAGLRAGASTAFQGRKVE